MIELGKHGLWCCWEMPATPLSLPWPCTIFSQSRLLVTNGCRYSTVDRPFVPVAYTPIDLVHIRSQITEMVVICTGGVQVGAKMGKSTRPIYWGPTVITGRSVVGDMLEWALWVTPIQ